MEQTHTAHTTRKAYQTPKMTATDMEAEEVVAYSPIDPEADIEDFVFEVCEEHDWWEDASTWRVFDEGLQNMDNDTEN